jgi:hypothetical protein
MLLDDLMPDFDVTRAEHRVIDASMPAVYDAALHVDLLDLARDNPLVRGIFALRTGGERLVAAVRGGTPEPAPAPDSLRLADLTDHGDWVLLGTDPPDEIAFGVVGRFWAGETSWEEIDASEFGSFDRPGFARIAANISLRPYGATRTLASYECRTQATDEAARHAFLRYWTVVTPGVGVVLRGTLRLIDRATARTPAPRR